MITEGNVKGSDSITKCGIATEKITKALEQLFGEEPSCSSVIAYAPTCYEIELPSKKLSDVSPGSKVIMNITPVSHWGSSSYRRNFGRKQIYQISAITDGGEPVQLLFFKIFPAQIQKFAVGKVNTISGRLEVVDGQYRIVHPQTERKGVVGIKAITRWRAIQNIEDQKPTQLTAGEVGSKDTLGRDAQEAECRSGVEERHDETEENITITPIYRLPKGISQEEYRQIVGKCIKHFEARLLSIHCQSNKEACRVISGAESPTMLQMFSLLHEPNNINCLKGLSEIRRCIGTFEVATNKIAISVADLESKKARKEPIVANGELRQRIIQKLPFTLTTDQQRAIEEITKDQSADVKASRLLQGDVGSGKTVVALAALLNVAEVGKKGILVAPTTVLATQHYRFFADTLFGENIQIFLLTGKVKASEKRKIEIAMQESNPCIIIGTHAVIESNYVRNCSLCIIDEQHRFGVNQRSALAENNPMADVLMMTATPIPRTMLSIMYDSMQISYVKEMPKSRKPISTSIISSLKLNEIMEHLSKKVKEGVKAYWICPAVEMTEEGSSIISTEERFGELKKFIEKDELLLIHGKLKESEKDQIMFDFANKTSGALLVATSVIEVGVNVPEATIIIIEQAERFGLSQLHQLRGRVGRGNKESYCILLYSQNSQPASIQKLSVIKNSNDGFKISEEDFKMRGAGDIIGVQQSGYSSFKVAGDQMNSEMLINAKSLAGKMLADSNSEKEEERENAKKSIINLLNIFGYTENIFKLIRN